MRREAARIAAASDPQEAELIARAKAWSPEAWTEIYSTYYRPVYRYVRVKVFDEATTEDLTASVFVAALEGIKSYRYRGRPLLAWLYRLARNIVSTHQRQVMRDRDRGRTHSPLTRLQTLGRLMPWSRDRSDEAGDLDSIAASSHEYDPAAIAGRLDLREALKQLTKEQREVVTLRFLVGLSTGEIAQVMGKSPSAVYSLAARAILTLRHHLGEEISESRDEFRPGRTIDPVEEQGQR